MNWDSFAQTISGIGNTAAAISQTVNTLNTPKVTATTTTSAPNSGGGGSQTGLIALVGLAALLLLKGGR